MTPAMLLRENEELREKVAQHESTLQSRDARIAELEQKVEQQQDEVQRLEHEKQELGGALSTVSREKELLERALKEALRKRAGIDLDAPGQRTLLFGEPEVKVEPPPHVDEAPDGETKQDKVEKKSRTRKPPRQLSYAALPREHVVHELPEDQRVCATTGLPLVRIGETLFEEIDHEPAKLVLIVHHKVIYGLSPEHAAERTVKPVSAELPPRAIEKSPASARLLAWMLVQKYAHHLPLHRQEVIFEREGLLIPRQTQCDWVMACAEGLEPLQARLRESILGSGVIQIDDTPVRCQQGKGKKLKQSSLWVLLSPLVEGVVFDFLPGRGYEPVSGLLGDLSGVLVGDGYAVHGKLADRSDGKLVTAGCWSHALRKFRDAIVESPQDAARMVATIAMLFQVEQQADELSLAPDARLDLRRQRCPERLADIEAQRKALAGRTSAKGKLADAVTYLTNQWTSLVRFLDDGRVPIHNNACERAIRPVAVGRRNWLFAGSPRGGRAAATVYSLVESCKLAGVNPLAYLSDVLVRVRTHPARLVDELLPARWKHTFGAAAPH